MFLFEKKSITFFIYIYDFILANMKMKEIQDIVGCGLDKVCKTFFFSNQMKFVYILLLYIYLNILLIVLFFL